MLTIILNVNSKQRYDESRQLTYVMLLSILSCRKQWKAESDKPLLSSEVCGVGTGYPFYCMCEIPGQMPCPSRRPLPEKFKGKWHLKPEERDLMDQIIYNFDDFPELKTELTDSDQ